MKTKEYSEFIDINVKTLSHFVLAALELRGTHFARWFTTRSPVPSGTGEVWVIEDDLLEQIIQEMNVLRHHFPTYA